MQDIVRFVVIPCRGTRKKKEHLRAGQVVKRLPGPENLFIDAWGISLSSDQAQNHLVLGFASELEAGPVKFNKRDFFRNPHRGAFKEGGDRRSRQPCSSTRLNCQVVGTPVRGCLFLCSPAIGRALPLFGLNSSGFRIHADHRITSWRSHVGDQIGLGFSRSKLQRCASKAVSCMKIKHLKELWMSRRWRRSLSSLSWHFACWHWPSRISIYQYRSMDTS